MNENYQEQFQLALNFFRGAFERESFGEINAEYFRETDFVQIKESALARYCSFLTSYSKVLAGKVGAYDSQIFYASYGISRVDFNNSFVSKLIKLAYARKYPEDISLWSYEI